MHQGHVAYPLHLHVEPSTPAHHFAQGKANPDFRTTLAIAVELIQQAVNAGIPGRGVVADHGLQQGIRELGTGYVRALKPSHACIEILILRRGWKVGCQLTSL